MVIEFTVFGKPQPKQRPRTVRKREFGKVVTRTYTPKETVEYEKKVRLAYLAAGGVKLDGGVTIMIKMYFQIPKSASKKSRELMRCGEIENTKHTGDIENVAKSVLDALNKVAYEDDSQVTRLVLRKLYADEPRTEVCVGNIGEKMLAM